MIKAWPLLSDIEAVRLPNQVISDVHAISANNHNYHYLGLILEISHVSISSNNCYCRYCLTLNVAPRRRYGLQQANVRWLSLIRIRALAVFDCKDTKNSWNEQENCKNLFRNLPIRMISDRFSWLCFDAAKLQKFSETSKERLVDFMRTPLRLLHYVKNIRNRNFS